VTALPAPEGLARARDGGCGRLLATVAAVVVLSVACTGGGTPDHSGIPTSAGSKREVKIAYVGALSGGNAKLVLPGYQAAQLAFELADQGKLGDLPVRITLVPEDTHGSADQAPAVVAGFAGDESFVGVIGPAFSNESEAVGALLDRSALPFVTPSAADPGLAQNGWSHWYRAIGNYDYQGPTDASYIVEKLSPTCVLVASDDTAYGQNVAGVVQGTLQGMGVQVVAQLSVVHGPPKQGLTTLVDAVRSSKCQVVFYGGNAAQAGPLRAQLSRSGLDHVTLVGGDGIKDDAFLKGAGAAADGTVATCFCADVTTSQDALARSFVQQYTARFGEPPGIYSAEAWDVAQMYIAALKSGKTTRKPIDGFFHTIHDFQGVTKSYTFGPNGELDPGSVVTYLYRVEGGAWTTLGPADQVLGG